MRISLAVLLFGALFWGCSRAVTAVEVDGMERLNAQWAGDIAPFQAALRNAALDYQTAKTARGDSVAAPAGADARYKDWYTKALAQIKRTETFLHANAGWFRRLPAERPAEAIVRRCWASRIDEYHRLYAGCAEVVATRPALP